MDKAYASAFEELAITLPCCGGTTSLNDLDYDWPAGFAKFVLEAMNPNVKDLDVEAVNRLEATLGCALRRIWTHY